MRGYEVLSINECEFFQKLKEKDAVLQQVVDEKLPTFSAKHKYEIKEMSIILNAVEDGELFGLVRCTIQVPVDKWETFKEFSPLFQTVDVPMECWGERMTQHVRQQKLTEKPRHLLVGGMKARNILLSTDLLRWYIQHGLEVLDIDLVVEFPKGKPFKNFQEMVTKARREGDKCDKTAKLRADLAKLLGVSEKIEKYLPHYEFKISHIERGIRMHMSEQGAIQTLPFLYYSGKSPLCK